MPDATLCGNGLPCPKCGGTGEGRAFMPARFVFGCGACRGRGRLPIPAAEIIAAQIAANAETERTRNDER